MVSFTCKECGKSLTRKRGLMNHLRLHRQKKIATEIQQNKKAKSEFQCALCSQCFASQVYLEQHTQLTHKRKPFRCSLCSFSTHYKGSLKDHKTAKHQPPEVKEHRCLHCKALFVQKSQLLHHERTHSGQFSVTCPQCGKGFHSEYDLKSHQPTHKRKPVCIEKKRGGISFKCGKCPETFAQRAFLKQHITKNHTKAKKKFPCKDCDFSTDHKSSLHRHRQAKHLNGVQKKFPCQECGKRFRSPSEVQVHLRVHSKQKPFTCDGCRKSFTRKSSLGRHIRHVHLKQIRERKHMCGDCGKSFCNKSNLSDHLEAKNAVKVKCELCGGQYANMPSLKVHLRRFHGSQPMFMCGLCHRGFTLMSNLKKHQRRHLSKPILID